MPGATFLTTSNWVGLPRLFRPDGSRRAVLFLGGVGCAKTCAFDTINGYFTRAIMERGLPVFASDALAHTWGNDAAMTAIDDLWTLAKSYGVRTDKVLLYGISQGSLNGMAWTMRNPGLVQGQAASLPIPSLAVMHDSPGFPNYTTDIENAYGGAAAYATAVASHDPNQNRAARGTVPIHFWYAADDPTAPPASVVSFASAIGAGTTNMGNVSHTQQPQYAGDIAAWLAARA